MSIPRVKVPIVLDRPRTILLSFNAFVLVEEVTGKSMLSGQLDLTSLRAIRAIMWAGLVHEDPALTLEQVGDLIEDYGIAKSMEDIGAAIQVALPELSVTEDGANASDPPDPQRGGISGQSESTTSG